MLYKIIKQILDYLLNKKGPGRSDRMVLVGFILGFFVASAGFLIVLVAIK